MLHNREEREDWRHAQTALVTEVSLSTYTF